MRTLKFFKDLDNKVLVREYKTPGDYYTFLKAQTHAGLVPIQFTDQIILTIAYVLMQRNWQLVSFEGMYPDDSGWLQPESITNCHLIGGELALDVADNGRIGIYGNNEDQAEAVIDLILTTLEKGIN